MLKKEREIEKAEAWACFDASPYATLSLVYENAPYAVPLSCARNQETLYFHCGKQGMKIEAIQQSKKAWISAVSYVYNPSDISTTFYTSCMMQGEIYEVVNEKEKRNALQVICERFAKDYVMQVNCIPPTKVFGIRILHITGKKHEMTNVIETNK